MKKAATCIIALILFSMPLPVFTQESSNQLVFLEETPGTFDSGGVSVEGAVMGDSFTVDQDVATAYELGPLSAFFSLVAPRSEERSVTVGGGQTMTIGYQQEGQATEIIRLTNLTVPEGPADQRISILANLMIQEGPRLAFSSWDDGSFEGIYRTTIGDKYDAVVLQGWVQSASEGTYWVRLCGIINPDSTGGVLVNVLIDPDLTGIQPDELTGKGRNLQIIHSIEFMQ